MFINLKFTEKYRAYKRIQEKFFHDFSANKLGLKLTRSINNVFKQLLMKLVPYFSAIPKLTKVQKRNQKVFSRSFLRRRFSLKLY